LSARSRIPRSPDIALPMDLIVAHERTAGARGRWAAEVEADEMILGRAGSGAAAC
jgi:hypothetical protein